MDVPMPGEDSAWTKTFVLEYSGDPIRTVDEVLADPAVPQIGTRMVDKPTWVVRDVSASPIPQSPRAWTIKVKYSTRADTDARRWFRITRSTSYRTAAGYRSGDAIFSGVPADGTVHYPPTVDIGGVKVDMNGAPLQWRIAQQTISVEHLWDRTHDTAPAAVGGAAASCDPPSEWTSVYSSCRNSTPFLGWPAGYVTYMGWTANQSPDEWLVVSHKFLADDWQHLEQRPVNDPSGKLILDTGPTIVGIPTRAAAKVYWYQPYEAMKDFSNLFKWRTNLWQQMTAPLPVWPTSTAP
jgi:hypothetical protein